MSGLAYVLSHGDDAVTEAAVRSMEQGGWRLVVRHGDADVPPVTVGPVTGVVYIPGLLAEGEGIKPDPVVALMDWLTPCGRTCHPQRMAAPGWWRSAVVTGWGGQAGPALRPRLLDW